ncbi:hypothetical protein PFISCL1PPCAC_10954, partial [Pristionchus fissidentatus]
IPLLHLTKLTPLSLIYCFISLIKVYIARRLFKSKASAENCMFLYTIAEFFLSISAMKYEQEQKSLDHLSQKINFFYDYTLYLSPGATIIAPVMYPTIITEDSGMLHYLIVQQIFVSMIFLFLETRASIARCITTAVDRCLFTEEYRPRDEKDIVLEVIDLKKQYNKWGLVVKGITFDVCR